MQSIKEERNIIEVWKHNLEDEMSLIAQLSEDYPWIAMDTEFPGSQGKPTADFCTQNDFAYQKLRCNVDMTKVIQIGITLVNEKGETARKNPNTDRDGSTWQFNFKFDIISDFSFGESLLILKKANIDFEKHKRDGMTMFEFGEVLTVSGLVLDNRKRWITYHGASDFAYVLKTLVFQPLPPTSREFYTILRKFFPVLYDIKYMAKFSVGLYGGLQDLADTFKIERQGIQHQAGSDSLLTAGVFFRLREIIEIEHEMSSIGYLFGISG